MKQKRLVSLIGALVVIISAVVLITGCTQPNSNKGNAGGGNSQKSLDGILCTNGDYYYFSGGTIYDVEISGSSATKRIAGNYVGTECNFGGGNKLIATVTSDTVILNGTTWTIIKNDTLVQLVVNAPVSP
ncbi:MAG: hypothetical protein ACTTH7_06695 [Treponema sp.]